MADSDERCLDQFPQWLASLGDDALALGQVLSGESLPEAARRQAAGALNYLFKSLDLIPDGIEELGFLDDTFVFRVAASLAGDAGADEAMKRLAADAELIREFLGEDYVRLEKFVQGLQQGAVRGRSVDEIVTDAAVASDLTGEVKGWAAAYEAPSFTRDEKNLVKLKSFLGAKLPG